MTESDLSDALDRHDRLVLACARGEIPFPEFVVAYDGFHSSWALDGSEAGPWERELLRRYATRIRLHARIRHEVEVFLTTEEHAANPEHRDRGFIGQEEGLRRLRRIAEEEGVERWHEATDE